MLAAAPAVAQDRGARDNGRSQSSDDRGRDRADQQRGSAFPVTTTADTVDTEPSDERCEDANRQCSLQAAVQQANATQGADEITLRQTRGPTR